MGIWEWVTAVLAIWGTVSILAAVFWVLIGRKIFRPRPVQPQKQGDPVVWTGDYATDRRQIDRRGGER